MNGFYHEIVTKCVTKRSQSLFFLSSRKDSIRNSVFCEFSDSVTCDSFSVNSASFLGQTMNICLFCVNILLTRFCSQDFYRYPSVFGGLRSRFSSVTRREGSKQLNLWVSEEFFLWFEAWLDKVSAGDTFSDRYRNFL